MSYTDTKNFLFEKYKNIAEKVLPTLKANNFLKTGMLTPKEFVEAGDFLIYRFGSFKWDTNNFKKSKKFNYLPKNKQCLVLRNVPCNNVKEIIETENSDYNILNIQEEQKEINNKKIKNELKNEVKNEVKNELKNEIKNKLKNDMREIDLYESLDDFEEENVEDYDECSLDDNLKKSKTFDVSITYDNYFRTPRIWLYGYDEGGMPLSYLNMMEHICKDNRNITATIEYHPFYEQQCLSIHPCKHSSVMKRLITMKKNVKVEHYFIYFLKFVSCIIPSLSFDFTADI